MLELYVHLTDSYMLTSVEWDIRAFIAAQREKDKQVGTSYFVGFHLIRLFLYLLLSM